MENLRMSQADPQQPSYGVLKPGRIGEDNVTASTDSIAPANTTSHIPMSGPPANFASTGVTPTASHNSTAASSVAPTSHTSTAASDVATTTTENGHHQHRFHMPHFRKHSNEATAKAAAPAAAAGAAATHGHGAHEIAGHTTPSGNHLIPGMEGIGSGYSGTAAASGDITAPTGTLPPGTIEKGATGYAIPRPSPKDLFKMHNSTHPTSPSSLAHRPVHQDPIYEADHIAPSHGGHAGNPGNMTTSFPTMHTEAVDPYAAGAHGDHLVRGLNAGTGYAGTAAANGDTHAPTGSLPAGTTELGATGKALPRPSPKDLFKMSNASHPTRPRDLAHRPVASDPLGHGTDVKH